jgi:hypothetical protein
MKTEAFVPLKCQALFELHDIRTCVFFIIIAARTLNVACVIISVRFKFSNLNTGNATGALYHNVSLI